MKKQFLIPVKYEIETRVLVEAESPSEAINKYHENPQEAMKNVVYTEIKGASEIAHYDVQRENEIEDVTGKTMNEILYPKKDNIVMTPVK